MSDGTLVVIVPSRGRPGAVAELAEAFAETCNAGTRLVFAVDGDDPDRDAYVEAVHAAGAELNTQPSGTMVSALNKAAIDVIQGYVDVQAVAFMGDDHRPRTEGWDRAYLDALRAQPGFVFGDDLIQGPNLPTQIAVSASVVATLGHMAPPTLTHLYVDNYWRDLGHRTNSLTYLPDVVVEHVHPIVGKAEWDEGHKRVNAQSMYDRDQLAYARYMDAHGAEDIAKVREAVAGARQ